MDEIVGIILYLLLRSKTYWIKKKKMIIYCRFWTWAHDDMWMKNKAGIKLDPKGQR